MRSLEPALGGSCARRSGREGDAVSSWWARLCNRRLLACILFGFASGLPFYVLATLLPASLRASGVALSEIAWLSWTRLPYAWKFLWAPWLDRYAVPSMARLGRRRDWALVMQLLLVGCIGALGWLNPVTARVGIGWIAVALALASATQDVVIDAYRREVLDESELGLGNSLAVNAYRVSGVVAGGLALYLADHIAWRWVYVCVAAFMAVGIVASLTAPKLSDPTQPAVRPGWLAPFLALFRGRGLRGSVTLLAFLVLYKLGDNLATSLTTPFYLDMGYSLTAIGTVVKAVSLWSTIGGSLLGGLWLARVGINRGLWVFGAVQLASILGFAALARWGSTLWHLSFAVAFEYLGIGLGTSAFVAFLARTTERRYSATQYAVLSGVVALPGIAVSSVAGHLVERLGYPSFFLLCALLGVPGMLLLPLVAPWRDTPPNPAPTSDGRADP